MEKWIVNYKEITVLKKEMGKYYLRDGLGNCFWISEYAMERLF